MKIVDIDLLIEKFNKYINTKEPKQVKIIAEKQEIEQQQVQLNCIIHDVKIWFKPKKDKQKQPKLIKKEDVEIFRKELYNIVSSLQDDFSIEVNISHTDLIKK